MKKQGEVTRYYDKFSRVYDLFSPRAYYHRARLQAIKELNLVEAMSVLNVPVGTGQNFEYFQTYLKNSGLIVGVDISTGMLAKAQKKILKNNWENIKLINQDILNIRSGEVSELIKQKKIGAIFCDLGLSGFPKWKEVIDILVSMLPANGRISIMDWYIESPSLRSKFVNWIGKGEVNRPIWQYLETKVTDFSVDASFNRGGVFVASGTKGA